MRRAAPTSLQAAFKAPQGRLGRQGPQGPGGLGPPDRLGRPVAAKDPPDRQDRRARPAPPSGRRGRRASTQRTSIFSISAQPHSSKSSRPRADRPSISTGRKVKSKVSLSHKTPFSRSATRPHQGLATLSCGSHKAELVVSLRPGHRTCTGSDPQHPHSRQHPARATSSASSSMAPSTGAAMA
jgi:hypothetical protein